MDTQAGPDKIDRLKEVRLSIGQLLAIIRAYKYADVEKTLEEERSGKRR